MQASILSRGALLSSLSLGALLPAVAFADTQVVVNVRVDNPPASPSIRVPAPGAYTLSVRHNRTRVALPDGTVMIFDFDKKVVSTLDTRQKNFYQQSIDDFLSFGDKLAPPLSSRFQNQATVTFAPTMGQEDRPIIGHTAAPYDEIRPVSLPLAISYPAWAAR
jgi:hypothetical protein